MGRHKGSTNKNSAETPAYMTLPASERIAVLANLIVDRIVEDQRNGGSLFKQMLEGGNDRSRTS
jgi:hypothetical protein